MKRYEMIREIFNACSGNQMRDVFFDEVETDDPQRLADAYLTGGEVRCDRSQPESGVTVFDIVSDGMRQRITFTEI